MTAAEEMEAALANGEIMRITCENTGRLDLPSGLYPVAMAKPIKPYRSSIVRGQGAIARGNDNIKTRLYAPKGSQYPIFEIAGPNADNGMVATASSRGWVFEDISFQGDRSTYGANAGFPTPGWANGIGLVIQQTEATEINRCMFTNLDRGLDIREVYAKPVGVGARRVIGILVRTCYFQCNRVGLYADRDKDSNYSNSSQLTVLNSEFDSHEIPIWMNWNGAQINGCLAQGKAPTGFNQTCHWGNNLTIGPMNYFENIHHHFKEDTNCVVTNSLLGRHYVAEEGAYVRLDNSRLGFDRRLRESWSIGKSTDTGHPVGWGSPDTGVERHERRGGTVFVDGMRYQDVMNVMWRFKAENGNFGNTNNTYGRWYCETGTVKIPITVATDLIPRTDRQFSEEHFVAQAGAILSNARLVVGETLIADEDAFLQVGYPNKPNAYLEIPMTRLVKGTVLNFKLPATLDGHASPLRTDWRRVPVEDKIQISLSSGKLISGKALLSFDVDYVDSIPSVN